MIKLQQLPNVLPTNVVFSTESIYIDNGLLYPIREETYINTGSSFFIEDSLSKYVLTINFGNIIVDCLLVGLKTSNSNIPTLYPIGLKYYKRYTDLFKQNKSTILLKKGIEAILSLCSPTARLQDLTFIAKYYMKSAMQLCYPDDNVQINNPCEINNYITENINLLGYTTDINLLNYLNNESNPGIDFSFNWFMNDVQMENLRFPAEPSRHIDLASDFITSTFSPVIPNILLKHPLTSTLITSGTIDLQQLTNSFRLSSVIYSDRLYEDTTINDIVSKSNIVFYAGCLANSFKDESLEISIYSFYEKIQTFPYIDGYIKYILLNRNTLEIDSKVSFLSNYYTSYFERNIDNKNYVISDLRKELFTLIDFNPFGLVDEIEIIIRDYIVLLTFISKCID